MKITLYAGYHKEGEELQYVAPFIGEELPENINVMNVSAVDILAVINDLIVNKPDNFMLEDMILSIEVTP